MKKKRRADRSTGRDRHSSRQLSLEEMPFAELVRRDQKLDQLRKEYAEKPAADRRNAAQWEYDRTHASFLVGRAVGNPDIFGPAWLGPVLALAIDPDYAPAIMSVATMEYQLGRVTDAMKLLLSLTSLPHDPELVQVIDESGDFLLDSDDSANAERLYASAAESFPEVACYCAGLGYCAAKDGRKEEAVLHTRRAVELEPDNYRHLNDLGYSLMEVDRYDEAEQILLRAVELAPADYEMARGNLIQLRARRKG